MIKKILILFLLGCSPALMAKKVMELKPADAPDTFVEQMQNQTDEALKDVVLESYINSLLKTNAISSTKDKKSISYSVRGFREGQLVVTRKEHREKDQHQLRSTRTLKVYGVGYSLDSDCSRYEQRCWLFYPNTDNRWLEISYAPNVMKELEKSMSLLIRELQK